MGYDSDAPEALGEVGRVGVPISSIEDMEVLLDGPAAGRGHDVDDHQRHGRRSCSRSTSRSPTGGASRAASLGGTVQNDILKEYIARGTYIYPTRPSMRLVTDIFEFCAAELPRWNTISISGYHMREAGATAAQELAFTLADAIAYVERARARGLDVDQFAGRLSFFFASWSELFEEVAKFRAARRMWARIMRDRFGAREARSMMCRFHTQTAGSSLTAAVHRQQRRADHGPGARRRSWAAPRACTPTRGTRRWPCRPRSRRGWRSGRSRSWPTRAASPRRPTRWRAATSWSR